LPESEEEAVKLTLNRVKKNCPAAMRLMGKKCIHEGDDEAAFKYFKKAAELGDMEAHYNLSIMYYKGGGVEKDTEKDIYHKEEAAIGGHPHARYNLGIYEWENSRFDRARKHWIIAASLGHHDSLEELRELYADGHASKEDYADALRAYQATVEATKSPEREEVESNEIRDKNMFTQPDESHWGECPICCLPLPQDESKCIFMNCCSTRLCNGCDYANQKHEKEAGLKRRCVFCREPLSESEEEAVKLTLNRVKKNCPAAMCQMGKKCIDEGDDEAAFKYFKKAAELGDAVAHYNLSIMYLHGGGVEKDMKKAIYHWEEAAIGGDAHARYNLGIYEKRNGRFERARKHFIIAANLGYNDSLKKLRELYADGHASKEDYADALRAYQATVEATKSPEREEVESL
jgi:TPR repeat protein